MRATAVVVCSLLAGCDAIAGDLSLTIRNRASRDLAEVYLTGAGAPDWGTNQLDRRLRPGNDLVVSGIGCGLYDLILVDEYDIACELPEMLLCFFDSDVLYREATPAEHSVAPLDFGGGVRCPPKLRVEVTDDVPAQGE